MVQYVNGVPQRPQKVRRTDGDEANSTGVPATNANVAASRCSHGTIAAADALRHVRHWHVVLTSGSPWMRYRTAPHRQPPSSACVITLPQDQAAPIADRSKPCLA